MIKVFFESRYILISHKIKDFTENNIYFQEYKKLNSVLRFVDAFFNDSKTEVYGILGEENEIVEKLENELKFIEAAGGLVKNSVEEFLFIKRNGYWDLPKGKLEQGETLEQNAVREVEEECGIKNPVITDFIQSTYHTYLLKGKLVLKKTYWYKMDLHGPYHNIKAQEEEGITEVKWVKKNDITSYMDYCFSSVKELLGAIL